MSTTTSSTDSLIVEVSDGVATLTLNRPERRNALSSEMVVALGAAVAELADNADVGAVLLTGAGGSFCVGGDVKQFGEQGGEGGTGGSVDPRRVAAQRSHQRAIVGGLYHLPKPVVAALPGAVAGAGLGIALAADLRIGCSTTLMAAGFLGVGLSGDYGVAWLLRNVVGDVLAREILLLGDRIAATRCLELGLVNRLVDDATITEQAYAVAHRLAHGPRLATANLKHNLVHAQGRSLEESMDAEVPLHMACGVTDDHREAVAAFLQKRKPRFGTDAAAADSGPGSRSN